jgi:hypothetical protein
LHLNNNDLINLIYFLENSLFYINSLPRFKGSISDSFEPYLHPYVESEEDELKKNIY